MVAEAGRVDLLVHAAGVMAGTFVRKESLETFESVLRTNLTSAFVVAHAALPAMPAGGRMVFLSSSSAHAPQPGKSAYSASKAGLNVFAGALAKEVERDGIAVHVVTTGPVATPMLDDVHFPMRTLGVDDVAQAVVWLDTLPRQRRAARAPAVVGGRGPVRPRGVRARGGPPARADRATRRLTTRGAATSSSAPPPSTTSTTATRRRGRTAIGRIVVVGAGRRRPSSVRRACVVVVAGGSDEPTRLIGGLAPSLT